MNLDLFAPGFQIVSKEFTDILLMNKLQQEIRILNE